MVENNFKAMIVTENGGQFDRSIENRSVHGLPEGDVVINVKYSSLNYKDALSASGNKGITQNYPHTPGIDAAGIVISSTDSSFMSGDKVIVTSYDLGMNTSGGFGQYIRVPASWVVKLPEGLSLKDSMGYGTAGLTAALSLFKLEFSGLVPSEEEILVTGATGGVGSMAVAILSRVGYRVVAATGKGDKADYLKQIGAYAVIDRAEVDDKSHKQLLKSRWAAVIDTVGGNILSTAIRSSNQWGVVVSCGLTQSVELNINVFPFILRGVTLVGINSERCPMGIRKELWNMIATAWKVPDLNSIYKECSLDELNGNIELMLKGQISGRIVVDMQR